MEFERATFGEDRFECLDTESVKGRGTVKKYRMFFDDFFEYVPNFGAYAFYHAFCAFDVMRVAVVDEFFHNERFEELDSHFFRKTALVEFEFRTYDDNGTTGVVDTFTEEVLTETTLFPFEHIAEGFERTVARARYRATAAAVVDEGIDCFLEHTFFVADDDVRCAKVEKAFQTVVTVDDAAIEVVEVACCEAAAVELYHRTEFRRDDRDDVEDHPGRFVAGFAECFYDFKATDGAYFALSADFFEFFAKFLVEFFKVKFFEELFDSFGTHAYFEGVAVFITIFAVFVLGEELFAHERRFARVEYDVGCEVEYFFECARGYIEDEAHAARDSFEVPDVRYRCGKFDMTHTVTTYFGARYFNAAAVADDAFVTDSFVLTAMTFPVTRWAEDAFTEQAVFFRF